MIVVFLLLGLTLIVIVLAITSRSDVVPWLEDMTRLNPGMYDRAEWMAPGQIVETIQRDYLAFYEYAALTLPNGWLEYLRNLDFYVCSDMLRVQRDSLDLRLRHDRGRFVSVMRANHAIQVRHFSADGMRCVVVDHQTEQRLATYDYWTNQRLHTQDMGDAVYIYQMQYDRHAKRWKIAGLIQHMEVSTYQANDMVLRLPRSVGRDG